MTEQPLSSVAGWRKWLPVLEAREAVLRFPLAAACCALFCFIALNVSGKSDGWHTTVMQTLFCGCFLFIAATLLAESRNMPVKLAQLPAAAIIALCGLLFYTVEASLTPFALLGGASFAAIYLAPFARRNTTAAQFWAFGYRLCFAISFGIVIAAILFFGLAAITSSIGYLFGIKMWQSLGDIFLICACVVGPLTAMANIPRRFDSETADYSHQGRLILVYLLLPLLAIYTAILYAYIAKIVGTLALPKGGVAVMVMTYGVVGTAAWLMCIPWRQTDDGPRLFTKWFYPALILPLFLLGLGISTRIADYGVTEDRYLVVTCLLWLVSVTAFVLVRPHKPAPQFMYASLIVLLVLSAFGPWGAQSVSVRSQTARLQAMLADTGLLVNGALVETVPAKAKADENAIRSTANYLYRHGGKAEVTALFVPYQTSVATPDMRKFINGLQPYGVRVRDHAEDNSQNFSYAFEKPNLMVVSGYDYALELNLYGGGERKIQLPVQGGALEDCQQVFDELAGLLMYRCGAGDSKTVRATFNLNPMLEKLAKAGDKSDASLFTIKPVSGDPKMGLMVKRISGRSYPAQNATPAYINVNNLSGVLLFRK